MNDYWMYNLYLKRLKFFCHYKVSVGFKNNRMHNEDICIATAILFSFIFTKLKDILLSNPVESRNRANYKMISRDFEISRGPVVRFLTPQRIEIQKCVIYPMIETTTFSGLIRHWNSIQSPSLQNWPP